MRLYKYKYFVVLWQISLNYYFHRIVIQCKKKLKKKSNYSKFLKYSIQIQIHIMDTKMDIRKCF